ncbi:MAG: hypothetical protein ACJAYC_000715 [Halieaceae bacterium]|jgi:hypothetical protein
MARFYTHISALALLMTVVVPHVMAEADRDCLLQGTVQKGSDGESGNTEVKFHSIGKYAEDSNCRIRRDKKIEFKLPDDPRLQDAPDGSEVKYRYRSNSEQQQTELISIGT